MKIDKKEGAPIKSKLNYILSVVSVCMFICAMAVGVYALSINLKISGAFGYVPPDIEIVDAEFKLGVNDTYETDICVINDTRYLTVVNPTTDANYVEYGGSYSDKTTYTCLTIDETKIYCPVVKTVASDGKTQFDNGDTWYQYFPVFYNAITIEDNLSIYDGTTPSVPDKANFSAVGLFQDGVETEAAIEVVFNFGTSPQSAPTGPYLPKNSSDGEDNVTIDYYVYRSGLLNATQSKDIRFVKYKYKSINEKDYYYYVCYYTAARSSCITAETLITLADGSQKMAKDLTGTEELLVFNHTTGLFEYSKIAYIYDYGSKDYFTVTQLNFSNGSTVEIVAEHVFFDVTLNKYVAINTNPEQYVGHEFIALSNSQNSLDVVTLESVTYEKRYTSMFEVVTFKNMTCFTENILSATAYVDTLLNVFEFDKDTFAYNQEKMQYEIQTYGLYTYKDFEGLLPEFAFELYNAQYLKVAVGRGDITWEHVLIMVSIFNKLDIKPIQQ